jgi:ATP-binding cassette subfamily B protein
MPGASGGLSMQHFILDEATSALDTATEYAIQQSQAALSQGRTTLVVAHRLATIRNADRIIVVGTSGIVEDGTHKQLLARQGSYAKLHEAQFGSVAQAFLTVRRRERLQSL